MIPQKIKDDVYFCEKVPLRAEVERTRVTFIIRFMSLYKSSMITMLQARNEMNKALTDMKNEEIKKFLNEHKCEFEMNIQGGAKGAL